MDKKMKRLHQIARLSILLTLVFMVIALVRYQREDEEADELLPERLEYYYDDDWQMVSLQDAKAADPEALDRLRERIEEAFAAEECQKVDLPYEGMGKTADILVFRNTLPPDWAGLTMDFTVENAKVRVVIDGETVCEYGFSEEDSESSDCFADIPHVLEEGEVWIELIPLVKGTAFTLGNVIVETRDMVVIGVFGNSIVDIGCCLLILMAAVLMFVLALIRWHTNQPSRGELFLGFAGLVAGVYCFIGTNTLSIFYDIQGAYEMQEYLVLLLPIFVALYFDWNQHKLYPRRYTALLWCVNVNVVLQILLQVVHLQTLEEMMKLSAVVLGIVCVTAMVSLMQYDYTNKKCQTLLSILALLGLLVGGISNIIINGVYKDESGTMVGRYSMAAFAIIIAVVHVLQLSKEYRARAEEHAWALADKVKAMRQQNKQLALAKMDAEVARQEALAANDAKGKFLAHMSHEIRTPINAVLGMDEMILREAKEQSIKEYAMDIHTAGQTLLSLINDILDFSKIESGKMEIVPVEYDISSMIHDLLNMATQRAEGKGLQLKAEVDRETPSRLYGDDVRIRQILTNILTNAVKYTQEGYVCLRLKSQRTEDVAILSFEVEDTGIGMKEEDLPKLFAEFERIEENRNRNIEGTGLGMSITTQLLALLGSKLQVESVYGKGSKFYFTLEQKIVDATPVGDFESRVQQIAENYNYSAKLYAPEAKILVVDDNAMNRKVLRNLLKETAIQVTDASGGRECLELVQENHYDLIFLDHMMPEMDGVETLHQIKLLSDYPCQGTPIVVLTANAVSGAKEKYLADGFDDFLSKPVVPDKLEKMIKKMLPRELVLDAADAPRDMAGPEDTEVSADLESLPPVDGLDWQYAWMHLPDMELLQYSMKEFYAQIDSAADKLVRAYEQLPDPEQLEQYRIQVHAMKSLAATVGILPLSGVAKMLEYAAKDEKLETIVSLTTLFLEEWRSYKEKLRGVFGLGEEVKKEVTDQSVVRALLEMVRISMQEMDIDQADQVMGQLREYDYPEEVGRNMGMLAEAVTNLNVEETERLTNLLIEQV